MESNHNDIDKDTNILSELKPVKDLTSITVLNNMIDGSENVDLKTDISNPKALALLKTISEVLKSRDYTLASGHIEFFIDTFLRYRISKNRLSRKELTEVLSARMIAEGEQQKETFESSFK